MTTKTEPPESGVRESGVTAGPSIAERFGICVPFIVGVTGHREILPEAEQSIRLHVRGTLRTLKEKLGSTPLLLLSGLAVGGDTICAEEALAAGIALCAVLPVPLERYEADFTPADRARLHALIDRAADVRVLDDQLDRGYVRVGETIARNSQLVIALWDGQEGRGPGGTADVVRMRLEGLPIDARFEQLGIDTETFLDAGPVVTIPTQRSLETPPVSELDLTYPRSFAGDPPPGRAFEAAGKRLARLNADLRSIARPGISRQASLDALSNTLQRRNALMTDALYVLAASAATVQILHLGDVVRSLLLAAAFALFAIAKRLGYEDRYQEYRAFGEALRVREAWIVAGIGVSVEAGYLHLRSGELQWIASALRAIDFIEPPHEAASTEALAPAAFSWFDGQLAYYRRSRLREDGRTKVMAKAGTLNLVAFIIATALATGLSFFANSFDSMTTAASRALTANCQTALVLLATLGAIVGSYGEKRGFAKNVRRYERMLDTFETIERRRTKLQPGDAAGARRLLLVIGFDALIEYADWLLQCRERPLNVPR